MNCSKGYNISDFQVWIFSFQLCCPPQAASSDDAEKQEYKLKNTYKLKTETEKYV